MLIYNAIFDGTQADAELYASGMVWDECEAQEQQQPTHSRHVETISGIDIYYDYAADYYYFTDEGKQ